ncbi:TIGR00296 family protein [Candidatus Bathyarchaeota archaeon]|nr:TIGR00296 family protein [Candidatus Bathyarchaeota archaeon]RJS70271.1 MAG: TIGR00296 family protein [Candidatus Bathyarchaeota archaeon]RLI14924.1 MAG: TIGR00296 family protein [Candidatus Bathyarchaeota archaeon]RLI20339.1 MAG: TIGR00296 family protein [Candidatus Bathyarchaeota archaeon]HDN05576.1 TIGR00296 family protein [Candidatus Bathyarchaeota archaeon]
MSLQLSLEEGEFLVKLARKAVEEYLKNRSRIKVPRETSEKLLRKCGVFVTINSVKKGKKELRGCIGFPYPTTPLAEAVIDAAISSATQDPRFYPVSLNELDSLVFEVSVLTPPQKVNVEKPSEYPSKIKVGEDGLIVERGVFKGLLLPQVPIEWKWDEEEFLCQCCVKAGLPPDCWLMENTKIYKFQAIIFEEEKPKGEIKRKTLGGK